MVKVEWHERGVSWTYSGSVNGEEIINASISIYADQRFDDLRYKLCDFLEADDISMTVSEMNKVVCQHAAAAHTNPDIKIAIIGNKVHFKKLSLLIERFRNYKSQHSWPIMLFDNQAEAREWLVIK